MSLRPITSGSTDAATTVVSPIPRCPMLARILCTADICDALSASRPYREGMPPERVLEIMGREVGTAIDPDCYSALEGVLQTAPGRAPSDNTPAARRCRRLPRTTTRRPRRRTINPGDLAGGTCHERRLSGSAECDVPCDPASLSSRARLTHSQPRRRRQPPHSRQSERHIRRSSRTSRCLPASTAPSSRRTSDNGPRWPPRSVTPRSQIGAGQRSDTAVHDQMGQPGADAHRGSAWRADHHNVRLGVPRQLAQYDEFVLVYGADSCRHCQLQRMACSQGAWERPTSCTPTLDIAATATTRITGPAALLSRARRHARVAKPLRAGLDGREQPHDAGQPAPVAHRSCKQSKGRVQSLGPGLFFLDQIGSDLAAVSSGRSMSHRSRIVSRYPAPDRRIRRWYTPCFCSASCKYTSRWRRIAPVSCR